MVMNCMVRTRCPASVPPISPCSPAASFRRNRTRVSSARTNIGTRILRFPRNVTVRTAQPGDAEPLRRAKAEVERFLASKIGLQYEKDDANRDELLQYLSDNGLSLTAENLATAFDACKSTLKLSQKIQQYNGTKVVDFGERVQNPSKITSELKETIRRKIARYDSSEYQDWLVRHPEEAALLDEL
jgi:hypothetical protein